MTGTGDNRAARHDRRRLDGHEQSVAPASLHAGDGHHAQAGNPTSRSQFTQYTPEPTATGSNGSTQQRTP